ncbi:MAG: MarR family transcriptional regulator [Lachnospiraceae bacterium]|nr:MarR family transcriptional regulator [Lachnospiraceae bacterium]
MACDYEQLKLKNQMCFPLYACARKIINAYTPFLKPVGLTYTQYIVFMVLWEKEEVTVGELGTSLHLDAGTLTPLLKKLEKEGYITRKRSKQDERITCIHLTDKGDKLKDKCADIPFKVASTLGVLDEKDLKELYRLLYLILDFDET